MITEKAITTRPGASQETALVDREAALYDQETRFAMAVKQRELLEEYIHDRLKPGKHFYKVAEGQKPSLTKEGAELVCLPHVLKPHYDQVGGPAEPPANDNPYQISVKCILEANGKFGGEGLGSASSHITKRTGERIPRQVDPGLRHNATLKMACKSAYIAATLNATAASEFFTQDMEEEGAGEGEGQTRTDSKQHWCQEHNTAYFKRGRMKNYAHPIGDTGQWCNEKEAQAEPPEAKASPEGQGVASTSESGPLVTPEAPPPLAAATQAQKMLLAERWRLRSDKPKKEALEELAQTIKTRCAQEGLTGLTAGLAATLLAELESPKPKAEAQQ